MFYMFECNKAVDIVGETWTAYLTGCDLIVSSLTRWCGVRRLVGSQNFLAGPSRLLVLLSNQSALCVTWASTLTVILAPPPMYVGPRTVSRCFAALRQLRHLCRHVTNTHHTTTARSLVVSLVHSCLGYNQSSNYNQLTNQPTKYKSIDWSGSQ